MRAAAVQLTATADGDATSRPPTGSRAPPRARRGARRAAREVVGARHAGGPRAGAEPLDGPALTLGARDRRASSASTSSPARSPSASTGADARRATPRVHVGPDGEDRAIYRKIHMFDVEVGGRDYRESEHEAPGDEIVVSARRPTASSSGLTVCYDLRFPELYRDPRRARRAGHRRAGRVHARHHARPLGGPAARPRDRGPGFVVAANQVGEHAPGPPLRRALDDRRPVGRRARAGARHRDVRRRRPRPRPPGARSAARCRRWPTAARRPTAGRPRSARWPRHAAAVDKRRLILDAAVRVFARQGFHTCRVSDIADEAGVAYGLVYHYFQSKDEVLDTLFLERWDVMLEAIREIDAPGHPGAREARGDRRRSSSTPTATTPT